MLYKYLPEQLHSTADAVAEFFDAERGYKKFNAEIEVYKGLEYRPTLSCSTHDRYIIGIEVVDTIASASIEAVVLDCVRVCLPMKLFLAFPVVNFDGGPSGAEIARARKLNLGLIAVRSDGAVQVVEEAQSLSFFAVRPIDKTRFPPKYRAPLAEAENTFKRTSPAKGCALVFDEVEAVSRALAKRTFKKGMWKPPSPGSKGATPKFEDGNWQPLMKQFAERLIHSRVPKLTSALMSRLLGIIPQRNQSGHKVRTLADLIAREEQLRTRFEHAVDLLHDLIVAEKSL